MADESWKIKRGVIRHYDRIASIYNELYGHEQSQKIRKALLSLNFNPSEDILDVGCGIGLLLKHMNGLACTFVGVDIARKPLEIAKKLIKSSIVNEAFLIRADADFLPFRDGVFDKVFAITLLQNMPNYISALNEMARVAKDDATIVVTGLKKTFSRKSFSETLKKAGLDFTLLDDEEIKCYIAFCRKNLPQNINRGELEIIAGW
ncbi:MAG: class I SAM-dependent methyltransferase [Candidatus Bathyarchaeia archaeon]|nr:class I SAM-dependent methyltransferase [Candidatus Bathyarchaeota archaeon]